MAWWLLEWDFEKGAHELHPWATRSNAGDVDTAAVPVIANVVCVCGTITELPSFGFLKNRRLINRKRREEWKKKKIHIEFKKPYCPDERRRKEDRRVAKVNRWPDRILLSLSLRMEQSRFVKGGILLVSAQ